MISQLGKVLWRFLPNAIHPVKIGRTLLRTQYSIYTDRTNPVPIPIPENQKMQPPVFPHPDFCLDHALPCHAMLMMQIDFSVPIKLPPAEQEQKNERNRKKRQGDNNRRRLFVPQIQNMHRSVHHAANPFRTEIWRTRMRS